MQSTRRHTVRLVLLLALAVLSLGALAPASHAAANNAGFAAEAPLAGPRYTGWVYLELNYCPPKMACALSYQVNTGAWRWTGQQWVRASIDGGWVYVSPYTGQWRWAWTQRSGWVAMTGERFERRSY